MSEVRHHIIHQQIIEVDIPRGRSVAAVQERIRNAWYDRILPGLDTVFSSLVDEGAIIRIDKLYVDLGQVSEAALEQQLTAKAIESIQKILEEKLRFEVGASDGVSVVPVRNADAEILLHFLARGRLPWWSTVKDLGRLEASMMEKGVVPGGFSARFLLAIGDPDGMRRLRFQFSRSFLQFLAAACIPSFSESDYASADPAEALAAFIRGGQSRFSDGAPASGKAAAPGGFPADEGRQRGDKHESGADEEDRTAAKEMTNGNREEGAISPGTGAGDDHEPGAKEQGSVTAKERTNGKREEGPGSSNTAPSPPASGLGEEDATSPGAAQNLSGRPGQVRPDEGTGADPGVVRKEKGLRDDEGVRGDKELRDDRELRDDKKLWRDKELRDDEAIFIELAGLVILHPFILPFFDALGLTEGRAFRDEACLHKAVHLLGWLATGESDMQEQRLILPKLLCGMALTAPIERAGIITEADEAEAENLLTAVISHWKALKNASPAALREAFLQREGRLIQLENGWQLDVEKKTLDVLMGSMPWGISVVKYPWMKALLFVNWG